MKDGRRVMDQVVLQYHSFCLVAFLFIEKEQQVQSFAQVVTKIRTLLGSMSMTILWLRIMRFFVFFTMVLGRLEG